MSKYLPVIGEQYFFMHREVIIIKIWDCFHLVKIKEISTGQFYYVDICTLTQEPDFSNSISLRLFKE